MTIWKLWQETVNRDPAKKLILDAGSQRWCTAEELDNKAWQLAERLSAFDLAGKTCVFCISNGSKWLAHFLALQKLGAIPVPLDPSTDVAIRHLQAHELGTAFLIGERDVLELDSDRQAPSAACLGKVTSGSTGLPAVLLFKTSEMVADGRNIISTMQIEPEDMNYGMIPFGHSYGLGNLVMPLILQGTAIACCTDILPRFAADEIARVGATVFPSVPSFFRALVQSDLGGRTIPTLRRVISAGSLLTPETARAFEAMFNRRIHNFYGSTETGGIAYDRSGEAGLEGKALGSPMDNVKVWLDPDGAITVCSDAVHTLGNPTLKAEKGVWQTGDIGRISPEGMLQIDGRRRPLAKIGGRRVDPLEVEQAIRSIAGVRDAVVVVTEGPMDDRLKAAVESSRSTGEIRMELGLRLPAWKLPRRLIVMEQLPRNERGKITRGIIDDLLRDARKPECR